MCWCLRVYWTVLHNLFARFFENIANVMICDHQHCCRLRDRHCYHCQCGCCCSCGFCCSPRRRDRDDQSSRTNIKMLTELEMSESNELMQQQQQQRQQKQFVEHDYVIVDDIDADYLPLEPRKIETESYYRIVDRATAEDLLTGGREDGACLVRPYKEADICIKYIVSIYAQQQFFHLFIRRIYENDLYGIGQEKPYEKLFHTPSDIIEFYSSNALQCTNKNTTISVVLKPIIP